MKRIFALIMSVAAIVACNKKQDPVEPINYTPKSCVISELSGKALQKVVFTSTERTKSSSEVYAYENSDWKLEKRTVTEQQFDTNGNITYRKYSEFSPEGMLISCEEERSSYTYLGTILSQSVTDLMGEDGEWHPYLMTKYEPNMELTLILGLTFSLWDGEKYVDYQKRAYSYQNNVMTEYFVYNYSDAEKKYLLEGQYEYVYDDYGRTKTITYNNKNGQDVSTVTNYQY